MKSQLIKNFQVTKLKKRICNIFSSIKLLLKIEILKNTLSHLLNEEKQLIAINNHLLSDQKKIKILNEQILNDSVLQHNYLKDKGWYLSFREQQSIDANNNPIPWYTYPAIDFAGKIIKSSYNVFEFGSGNSSLWFASKCSTIKSVEHDEKWCKYLSNKAPNNLNICYRPKQSTQNYDLKLENLVEDYFKFFPDPEDTKENESYGLLSRPYLNYCTELYASNIPYDIIVIDSVARGLSSFLASHRLAQNGYIIFDNSNWSQYDWILNYLRSQGFGRIDFYGPGPQNNYGWCTSFLSKKFNNLYV